MPLMPYGRYSETVFGIASELARRRKEEEERLAAQMAAITSPPLAPEAPGLAAGLPEPVMQPPLQAPIEPTWSAPQEAPRLTDVFARDVALAPPEQEILEARTFLPEYPPPLEQELAQMPFPLRPGEKGIRGELASGFMSSIPGRMARQLVDVFAPKRAAQGAKVLQAIEENLARERAEAPAGEQLGRTIARGAAQYGPSLPAYLAGGTVGGAAAGAMGLAPGLAGVVGGAAALGLPETGVAGLEAIARARGSEIPEAERARPLQAAVMGAALGGIGGLFKSLGVRVGGKEATRLAKTLLGVGELGTETVALTQIGALGTGQQPKARDYLDTFIFLGLLHGAGAVTREVTRWSDINRFKRDLPPNLRAQLNATGKILNDINPKWGPRWKEFLGAPARVWNGLTSEVKAYYINKWNALQRYARTGQTGAPGGLEAPPAPAPTGPTLGEIFNPLRPEPFPAAQAATAGVRGAVRVPGAGQPPAEAGKKPGRKLLSPQQISDFEVGRDRVVREGKRAFVVDTQGQRKRVEVQPDEITPKDVERFKALPPEKRDIMENVVRTTPYLSEEGRAERLSAIQSIREERAPVEGVAPVEAQPAPPAEEVAPASTRADVARRIFDAIRLDLTAGKAVPLPSAYKTKRLTSPESLRLRGNTIELYAGRRTGWVDVGRDVLDYWASAKKIEGPTDFSIRASRTTTIVKPEAEAEKPGKPIPVTPEPAPAELPKPPEPAPSPEREKPPIGEARREAAVPLVKTRLTEAAEKAKRRMEQAKEIRRISLADLRAKAKANGINANQTRERLEAQLRGDEPPVYRKGYAPKEEAPVAPAEKPPAPEKPFPEAVKPLEEIFKPRPLLTEPVAPAFIRNAAKKMGIALNQPLNDIRAQVEGKQAPKYRKGYTPPPAPEAPTEPRPLELAPEPTVPVKKPTPIRLAPKAQAIGAARRRAGPVDLEEEGLSLAPLKGAERRQEVLSQVESSRNVPWLQRIFAHPKAPADVTKAASRRLAELAREGGPPLWPPAEAPPGKPPVEPPDDAFAAPGDVDIRAVTESAVTRAVRTRKAEITKRHAIAEEWERRHSDRELSDIGAAVERVGNLSKPGDTHGAVRARMTPEMQKTLEEYRQAQEDARQEVNAYLREMGDAEYIRFLDNYIPHVYAGRSKAVKNFNNWFVNNSPNAKRRVLPTLQEAVEHGLTPLTQNVAELHKIWSGINWRVATTRRLLAELKDIKQADGTPIIVKPNDAPPGYVFTDDPAVGRLYAHKDEDGNLVLWRGGAKVHPEAWRSLRMILEKPFDSRVVRAIEAFNIFTKRTALSLSFFHHFALTESAVATLGGRKGLRVLGKAATYKLGLERAKDPEFVRDATMNGLELGTAPTLGIHRYRKWLMELEARTRNIPVARDLTKTLRRAYEWFDKGLWDRYYRGLKAEAWATLVEKELIDAPPNVSAEQAKQEVARLVNDAFGGLEWERMFWASPKTRQLLNIVMFAPDWTLSNLFVAGTPFSGLAPQRGKTLSQQHLDAVRRRLGRRYWANMITFLVAGTIAANKIFSGKWPWENEPGRRTQIDVTRLVRLLPWIKKDDKRRYYIHYGKQAREVLGWLADPLKEFGKKSSMALRVVTEQLFEKTPGSDYPVRWKRDEKVQSFWESVPSRVIEIADKATPFAFSGTQFAFTFPMRKGASAWQSTRDLEEFFFNYAEPGVISALKRMKWVNDAEGRLKDLAAGARANGVDPEKTMGYALANVRGYYYGRLWRAIDAGDLKKADDAAEALIRLGITPRGFAGSAERRGIGREGAEIAATLLGKHGAKSKPFPFGE